MKNIIFLIIALLLFYGCDGETVRETKINQLGTTSIKKNDEQNSNNDLYKITIKQDSPKLDKKPFKKIYINLKKLTNSKQFSAYKWYEIDLSFFNQKATAYANCYKITASYIETNTTIMFSNVNLKLDLDHSFCHEFKDADQAIYEMFSHNYQIEEFNTNEIIIQTEDSKDKIKLTR